MAADDYNDRVRALFHAAAYAGELPEPSDGAVTVEVDEGGAGARILLTGVTDGATLAAVRYRVFGCPQLIAAAELCCERFEGGPVQDLEHFSVDEIRAELSVPIEKTGKLLLLQDALGSLQRRLMQATNG